MGSIKVEEVTSLAEVLLPAAKIVADPLGSGRGQVCLELLRYGPDGITDQLERGNLVTESGARKPWPPVKPFGSRASPDRPLHRTGFLLGSWQGRTNLSHEAVHKGSLEVGVRGYPAVHQAGATVRPRRYGADGRSAMRGYLGLTFGVWIPEGRLRRGLKIPPRRVGLAPAAVDRVGDYLVSRVEEALGG